MANNNKITCNICTEDKAWWNMFTNGKCSHNFFCKDCISNHIAAKVEDNIANVKCPQPGCEAPLDLDICQSFLSQNVLDRWGDVLCQALILRLRKVYCPFPECSLVLIDDGAEVVTDAECPSCKRMFCAKCNVKWHLGVNCEDFQKLSLNEEGRKDLIAMNFAAEKNWKRCPHCGIYVERIEGCSYILCRCGSKFCYSCGAMWGGSHACPESAEARVHHR